MRWRGLAASLHGQADCSAALRCGANHRCQTPGSSSVPGSPPDGPVSNGECISTASREVPQGLSASYLKILWPSTQSPQNALSYPPARGAFPPRCPQDNPQPGQRRVEGAGSRSLTSATLASRACSTSS